MKRYFLLFVLLPLLGFYGCDCKKGSLIILHTNDTHSRIEEFPEKDVKNAKTAGYARRAAYINAFRDTSSAAVLLVDAGDVFQGTPYFNFFSGELEYKLMSQMGYEAGTLGNHEFDNGVESLAKALKFAKFPIVVSNYNVQNTPLKEIVKPFVVLKKGNFTVGILGIGCNPESLIDSANFAGILYENPIEKANEYAKLLKKDKKCDLVICLSHQGSFYESPLQITDSTLASQSQNIDIIIGGHTHKPITEKTFVKNIDNQNVLLSQAMKNGAGVGKIVWGKP